MFLVYDKQMNLKPFPSGVRPLDIFISSIQKAHQSLRVEGRPGIITMDQIHQTRPIEITFMLEAENTRDYRMLRNEVFSFFDDDYFYIVEQHDQTKRYKVAVVNPYIPNRLSQYVAEVRIMLDMVDLPYAESVSTTQGELSENMLWWSKREQPDINLSDLQYNFDTDTFRVYNGGNVSIHPFYQDLAITIEVNNAEYYELKNLTNGTTFRVNEPLSNQVISIDGATVTSNGLQFLRKTNKQFIELSPGWNEFTTSDSHNISFDFRFYYK